MQHYFPQKTNFLISRDSFTDEFVYSSLLNRYEQEAFLVTAKPWEICDTNFVDLGGMKSWV